MSIALIKGVGGTLETDFLGRHVTTCTVSLFTGNGAAKITAATATVDPVATTISAVAAEETEVEVADATGIRPGRRYLLGTDGDAEPTETATVLKVSGTTVTLTASLLYAHSDGAAFAGTRVSHAVSASEADVLWWDGYADFTPDTGDIQTEVTDCVLRKIPEILIDEVSIGLIQPKWRNILDVELDLRLAFREARDEFLRLLGGKFRAHCMLGTEHLRRACALTFWKLRRHSLGDDWRAFADDIDKDLDRELIDLQGQIPTDNDQDGTTTGVNDKAFTMISLERA